MGTSLGLGPRSEASGILLQEALPGVVGGGRAAALSPPLLITKKAHGTEWWASPDSLLGVLFDSF